MSETNETSAVHDYAHLHVYLVDPYYLMTRYSTVKNKHIICHTAPYCTLDYPLLFLKWSRERCTKSTDIVHRTIYFIFMFNLFPQKKQITGAFPET